MDTVFVKVPVSERLPPKEDTEVARAKGWNLPVNYSKNVFVQVHLSNGNTQLLELYYFHYTGQWVKENGDTPISISSYEWWLEEISVDEFIQRELQEQYKVEL